MSYTGKLYQISEDRGWNHVIFDLNPNHQLSIPVHIIEPGDVFLVLEKDIIDFWMNFEDEEIANHLCLKILYQDIVGWITVLPDDIVEVSNTLGE